MVGGCHRGRYTQVLALTVIVALVLGLIWASTEARANPQPDIGVTADIGVTDVTVTPETPAPGQTVTVRVTITNSDGSQDALEGTDVALRSARDFEGELEYARVSDLGTIPTGSSVEVPLTVTFDEPGIKKLRVHIWGTVDNSVVTPRYPVTIRVTDERPKLDASVNGTVAGSEGSGTISVSNGLDSKIRNVELTIDAGADAIDVTDDRSVFAELESGETREIDFEYEATQPGTYKVTGTLAYSDTAGQVKTVTEQFQVDVEPLRGSVSLSATPVEGNVEVDIVNMHNLPIENVLIEGTSPNATVEQRYLGEISAETSKSFNLSTTTEEPRAEVNVTMRYEVAGMERTTSDTVEFSSVPGRIDLTGIETEFSDGRLIISGSASNVGLQDVESAVIRVKDTANISPAPPSREYVIGTVPKSDFVSFEVSAHLQERVDSIPLEVTYLVNGEEYTETIRVPFDPRFAQSQQQSTEQNSFAETVVGFVTILLIGGVLVRTVRRRSPVSALREKWRDVRD